jgi:hypothetical protein
MIFCMMHAGAEGGNGPPSHLTFGQALSSRETTRGISSNGTPPALAARRQSADGGCARIYVCRRAGQGSANPFEKLNGYWSGGGTVTPLKGNPEKVSCRATYKVEGASVVQNVRCTGVDHKFSANFNLTYKSGRISGSWSEAMYAASGGVTGTASGSSVRSRLSGDKFSGRMSIDVSGSRHTITIVQLDKGSGAYRPVASLSLHR